MYPEKVTKSRTPLKQAGQNRAAEQAEKKKDCMLNWRGTKKTNTEGSDD